MRYKLKEILLVAILTICTKAVFAADRQSAIETILLEPVEMENMQLWVPADTTGAMINRACTTKTNCPYSFSLPASVVHTKTEDCPDGIARLLAEYTAGYQSGALPLTIFNGWQWEYSYSLCQFQSVSYDLPSRGGCWENTWEAILTQSTGSISFQWLQIPFADTSGNEPTNITQRSDIEVKTFSSVRTRDGYPKKRQL
jgi:hypothetical protein